MPLHYWLLALAVGFIASAPAHADPISGAVVAAIGLTGTAATVATAAGTFLITAGISTGLSYLSRTLGKKTAGESASSSQTTLDLQLDADRARTLVFGSRAVGGSLHYFCKFGAQNEFLRLAIVLADHEIDSLQQVWVNDTAISMHMDDAGWQDVPEFKNKYGVTTLWFRLQKGTVDQAADAELIADSGGQWTDAHRLRGCAWVDVLILWDPEVWGSSLPTFRWLINGAKLYDPRLDSTMPGGSGPMRWGQPSTYVFADNLEIARYNFLRGIYVNGDKWFGVGLSADQIDLNSTHAGIAACAEPVLTRAGTYEPRYRVAAVIDADESYRSVLEKFSVACAGSLPDLSGQYALLPGVAQVPVISFTDTDLIAGADITGSRFRPFDEVVCEVTGSWASPEALYETTALPTRYSSADEEADGGFRRSANYDLSYVASQSQGQRCLEIFRRLARRQITHKITLRRRFCVVEAGDWVLWSSEKYGYVDGVFRVESAEPNDDMSATLQLREIDNGVYAWSVDDEQDPDNPTDLPSGGAGSNIVINVEVSIAQVNGIDGTQVPGIRVTWTPITDLTVYGALIEYRRVGDVPWLTYTAGETQVREGAATMTAGIIGGEFYQARVTPLVSPRRTVLTSAIATTDTASVEVIVNRALVSTVTEAVNPGSITNDALAALTRQQFDAAARRLDEASVQGFVEMVTRHTGDEALGRADRVTSATIEEVRTTSTENGVAIANLRTTLTAETAARLAAIQTEQTARADGDAAVASQITTLVAQEATDRGAAINAEQTARIAGDTANAGQINTLVTQVGANTAAISAETTARSNADSAMTTSINTATARANLASANGQWGVVTTAGVNGAASSYIVALQAGAIGAGFRMDAMSGGTSRTVFSVGSFMIEDPGSGYIGAVFQYYAGAFELNGNVRVNGNLVVTGTITSTQISETSNLGVLAQMAGSRYTDTVLDTGWYDVQSPIGMNVPTRGGVSSPMIWVRSVCSARQDTAGTGSHVTQLRVLINGVVVYAPGDVANFSFSGAGSQRDQYHDVFQANVPGGSLVFQLQGRVVTNGNAYGNSAWKLSILNQAR